MGAAVGAIAGGLGGKAAGEKFNPTDASELRRFIDYTVTDMRGEKVGTVDAVWEDGTGQPYYLAVRTGWLGFGKAHVVPAESADVNEQRRTIRLPFDAERIKNAPSFDCAADMDDSSHRSVHDYFGSGERMQHREREDATRDTRDEALVELKTEEVKVGKREVEYGGIRLRKIVRTETVNQPVELKREEIVIERTPVRGDAARDPQFRRKGDLRASPPRGTGGRETEEVHVGKRTDTDRRDIHEEVRHEDVEIEKEGEAEIAGHRGESGH